MADDDAPMRRLDRGAASELKAPVGRFLKATELDTRMLGMVGALLLIWIGLHIRLSEAGGLFLTPRNLWNLSVQSSSIAIMATGMVLVIVTRNIDLSVGSVLGFVGMIMGVTQASSCRRSSASARHPVGLDDRAAGGGIVVGAAIGALQGFIIAYAWACPAFIVTLGGLLVWRGAAWWVTSGRTVAPMDATFRLMGGGPAGSIGATWSWIIGRARLPRRRLPMLINGRSASAFQASRCGPVWAEAFRFGFAAPRPRRGLDRQFLSVAGRHRAALLRRNGLDGAGRRPVHRPRHRHSGADRDRRRHRDDLHHHRTRFGRYVFAIGGNPEAAELAGINTRWVTMKIFMLMGLLVRSAPPRSRRRASTPRPMRRARSTSCW
jgi:D-xylose transport system permease protein